MSLVTHSTPLAYCAIVGIALLKAAAKVVTRLSWVKYNNHALSDVINKHILDILNIAIFQTMLFL